MAAVDIDPLHRRSARYIDGNFDRGWLYRDGLNPVAEVNAQSAVVSRFVYGTQPFVPEYMIKDGRTLRIVTDHLG